MSERIRQPKTLRHLERLKQLVRGEIPPPPIAELLGFHLVEIELGRSTIRLEASKRHANPMGTLHGGVISDVADAALGLAMVTTVEEDESFTTLDLTAKYFKPIWNARLSFDARVTKRTRALGLIECDVTDETGSLVARAYSTCMVLRGEEAKGR
ncbi:PaaI family thioesterase [Pendulispora albinea]|uniref:PaaI family thioesterase n=1 Tax=Pendulispora albinea TaxID=2741071 RepID=A0ABZ2LLV2_9BACT